MKKYTTMKSVVSDFRKVYRCGAFDLSNLGIEAWYYNSGVYGWNCDIFVSPDFGIAICSGYRNMRGERLPDEIIRHYTEKCRQLPAFGALEARKRLIKEFWQCVRHYAQTGEIAYDTPIEAPIEQGCYTERF